MRILLVGAGGVGTAFARIAARRAVRRTGHRRLRPRPGHSARPRPATASPPSSWTRGTSEAVASLLAEHTLRRADERDRPAVRHAAVPGRARGRAPTTWTWRCRCPSHTRTIRTSRPASSSATSSSPWPGEWEERGKLALVGMGVEPGLSDVFARYAADDAVQRDRPRSACGTARTWSVAGLRLRAHLLHLDHDRGVPEPAGGLGGGPRLVHHARRSASPRSSTSRPASARSSA